MGRGVRAASESLREPPMPSGSHLLSAYCVPGTVPGTGDGLEEGQISGRGRVLLLPQPICQPVETRGITVC